MADLVCQTFTKFTASNLVEESVMFPCIPKGYNQTSDHGILPNFKDRKIWNFNLQGNFKACRGDIHALFQEQGIIFGIHNFILKLCARKIVFPFI